LRFIQILALVGWFFIFQHEFADKAIVKGIVGPFSSQLICDEARFSLAAAIEQSGVADQIGVCFEQQDA